MKEQLQLLGKYLGHGVKVIDGKHEQELTASMLTEDAFLFSNGNLKPVLFSFEDLTKEVELNGERFVPYRKLCADEFGETYKDEEAKKERRGIAIPIAGGPTHLYIGREFSVCYISYLEDGTYKTMTPVNQYWYYEWFIAHHFAVGLEEDQYIRKTA